jgi:ABC-type antimicrobial peptide transport system permease subunit
LFGVSAVDPATYWLTAALILAVNCAAAYLSARRVVRIDPLAALRVE